VHDAQRNGCKPARRTVMTIIHATAIVDSNAELDDSVEIGAYSIIGPHVKIGARTKVGPHVVIDGHTTIGCDNTFSPFSSIGGAPQDKKYGGEQTRLEIGDRNLIREFCTFNLGTAQDAGVTRLGNDNWILAYVHLAHDCQVGSNTIFSNNAALGGHVHVGDWVIVSGFAAVHQFCKVGAHAFIGMNTSLTQDVPPFVLLSGNPAEPHGINIEGLKRRGFTREQIGDIRNAYKLIYKSGLTLDEAKAALLKAEADAPESADYLRMMREFLGSTTRGIVR
jgi:UDP-N-acetylglucosamine acyltransferase